MGADVPSKMEWRLLSLSILDEEPVQLVKLLGPIEVRLGGGWLPLGMFK